MPPLLVRADADPRQGAGHVMRSLSLAQEWRARGGGVRFITVRPHPELLRRINLAGATAVAIDAPAPHRSDLESTLQIIERLQAVSASPVWVVLDGYHFDYDYQIRIRRAGCRLLVIDDNGHLPRYEADIVLNHGVHAPGIDYRTKDDTWCLLGTHYPMLRPEFSRWHGLQRRIDGRVKNLLVTLGGGDADNLTRKVLLALRQVDDLDLNVKVLIGALNPHHDELRALTETHSNIDLQTDISDPSPLMAWADIAIAAGGTTAWELAFMQVPALLIVVAKNQEVGVAGIHRFGAAQSLGRGEGLDCATIAAELRKLSGDAVLRRRMAGQGRILVDGLGVERIVSTMQARQRGFSVDDAFLRPATADDRLLLWQWANDSLVRQNSFHTQAIDWSDHEVWCAGQFASPDFRIWIMQIAGLPVGQIRYERIEGGTAEIGLSIARGFRNQRLGAKLLEASSERALRELGVSCLQGAVRIDNEASCRAFLRAGFHRSKQENGDGGARWLFRRAIQESGRMEDHDTAH